jgi:hypothetical protein
MINRSQGFIFGGRNEKGFTNKFHKITIRKYPNAGNDAYMTLIEDQPMVGDSIPERAGHSSILISDKLYIYGGIGNEEVHNDMYVVDISLSTVKKIFIRGPAPPIAFGFGFHLFDNNIILYGGYDGDKNSDDMFIFDLKHERWSVVQQVKKLENIHIGGYSAMIHGSLMLIGGYSSVNVN